MQFEWDASKNRANLLKHGIDFATAARVFADPDCMLLEDRIDKTGERRWHALGRAGGTEPVLIVVHVYRESSDAEEIIRIISARKARARESRAYFQ
ncbi:MAG: BrnT family toxin [Acidobacteria bacterium]|nr:BrnT family toxin [Acidobacteriota bacterium]